MSCVPGQLEIQQQRLAVENAFGVWFAPRQKE
jgi:hypothetical protein